MTRLEQERRRRQLTQVQLAQAASVARPIISQVENGLRPHYSRNAKKLAAFLGLEVPQLAQTAVLPPSARGMLAELSA